MWPELINGLVLYFGVIVIMLLQTRFQPVRETPWLFGIMTVLLPVWLYFRFNHHDPDTLVFTTWYVLAVYVIFMTFHSSRNASPVLNETYILTYTLLFWYVFISSIIETGFNPWWLLVPAIGIVPTFVILKASFQHKKLSELEKLILIYWFLFTVVFNYVDQFFLGHVHPALTSHAVSFEHISALLFTATQLYFIGTAAALFLGSLPLFRFGKHTTWKEAVKNAHEVRGNKLNAFVDFQAHPILSMTVIVCSILVFFLDYAFGLRAYVMLLYFFVFPLVFFYLKWSPENKQ